MPAIWEVVVSNALVVVLLAAGVAVLGRLWKNPLCLHLLWLLVLLKLVTPPVLTVPVSLPARDAAIASAQPAANEIARRSADDGAMIEGMPIGAVGPEEQGGVADDRAVSGALFLDPGARRDLTPDESAGDVRYLDTPTVSDDPAGEIAAAGAVAQPREIPWPVVFACVWATGTALLAIGHAWRILRFSRLLRGSVIAPATIREAAAGVANRLGLRRVPEIRMLPVCVSPLVWAIGGRPRVYLPTALFERLDEAAREAILAHELAHVRRGDHWVRLLEVVATALFWWHPVVWLAARRLRELEDECCDCLVVAMAPHEAKSYATALLDTLDFLSERAISAPLGATAAKSSQSMQRRIAMLKNRSWTVRMGVRQIVVLLAVAALPMALAFGEKRQEPAADKPADAVAAPDTESAKAAVEEPKKVEAGRPVVASESQPPFDPTPQLRIKLAVVEVPKQSEWARRLSHEGQYDGFLSSSPQPAWTQPGGGMIISEAERKRLIEENRAGVRTEPTLVCPMGAYAHVKGNIGQQSLLACGVIAYRVEENGALRLRIRPVVTLGRLDKWEEAVKLSRPDDWPAAVLADLKPDEAAVVGGWDDPAVLPVGKDRVTVLVVQAALDDPSKLKQCVTKKRAVGKRIVDFPIATDLSTPESAMAALQRAYSNADVHGIFELCWLQGDAENFKYVEQELKKNPKEALQQVLEIQVVEVLSYADDFAVVVSKGPGDSSFCGSYFMRINGVWKSFRGCNDEGSWPKIEYVETCVESGKFTSWQHFLMLRKFIEKKGSAIVVGDEYYKQLVAQYEPRSKLREATKPLPKQPTAAEGANKDRNSASTSGYQARDTATTSYPSREERWLNAATVDVDLIMVAVPRDSEVVKLLDRSGVFLSEAEFVKLFRENRNGRIGAYGQEHCRPDRENWMRCRMNSELGPQTLLAFKFVPEIANDDTVALKIEPVCKLAMGSDLDTEGVALARPAAWPKSVHAKLKEGEWLVLGGWDDQRSAPRGKDQVTVFVVSAKRSTKPVKVVKANPTHPELQRRTILKATTDYPEKPDLSTPESAAAAWNRASGRMDDEALLQLSWIKWGPREIEKAKQQRQKDPKDAEIYAAAQLNAEIVEVTTYRDDFADVLCKLKFPEGAGRDPYSSRSFGRINGVWKNLGEDRLPSVEAARRNFDRKKDNLWQHYVSVRDKIKKGETVTVRSGIEQRFPPMAPGTPLGISVEKADLMGRVEWAMMHGARDITARKSLEWGEVEKNKDGNRTIRYMFEATIWGKDVVIINKVFTFDDKGNMLKMEDVDGYPKKKVVEPADVTTQAGMKRLVEDFFTKNFRDVTARETIEWGDVAKSPDGNSSIRYKYRARIWDRETMIMNQVFTFNPKGEFVSVKNLDGFPKKEAEKGTNVNGKAADAVAQADGPAEVVAAFLEAVKTGNDKAAAKMLSTAARQKSAAFNRGLTPPASDTAKFAVGKVEYTGQDGARVAATWTDLDADKRPKTYEIVWVLRRESDGWRITGVATQFFPDSAPMTLNFEDPADIHSKIQQVRKEMQDRAERTEKR
jgi:beta-lactamase regulating signal transducer with metallopeptidase domain